MNLRHPLQFVQRRPGGFDGRRPLRSTMAVASSAAKVVARDETTGLMQSVPVNRRPVLLRIVFAHGKQQRLRLDFDSAQGVETGLLARAADCRQFLPIETDGEFALTRLDRGLDAGDLPRLFEVDVGNLRRRSF
jgi:hypothetical protein